MFAMAKPMIMKILQPHHLAWMNAMDYFSPILSYPAKKNIQG
jgi:hypothetical protein